jgi:hypothetical protein
MPSVVNVDEEIRSCMDVSSDDEMIEIISTLRLPESFTVNDLALCFVPPAAITVNALWHRRISARCDLPNQRNSSL